MSEEWAEALGGRGPTGPVAPEIKKALSFFSPKQATFCQGSWKAHYKPVIDPRLLVEVNFDGSGFPR